MPQKYLFKTPPGEGLFECTKSFEKCYLEDPFNTFLIVPTKRLAEKIKSELLKSGSAILSDSVLDPKDFAKNRIMQDSVQNPRIISDEDVKMLLSNVLRKNKKNVEALSLSGDFSLRLVADLLTLFSVIDERCVDFPGVLKDVSSLKTRALGRIYTDFSEIMREKGMVYPANIYKKASEAKNGMEGKKIFIFGIYEPLPSLRQFICSLYEDGADIHYYLPYCQNERVFADDGGWLSPDLVSFIADGEEPGPFSSLFGESIKETGKNEPLIYQNRFSKVEKEFEAIAQEISDLIKSGVKPSEICVATPDPAGATGIAEEIFPDFCIPFSSSATISLSRSPLVQAVMLINEVIVSNFGREEVIAMFSSDYLSLCSDPSLIDYIAKKAMIEDGLSYWGRNIESLIARNMASLSLPDTPDYRKERLEKEIDDAIMVRDAVMPVLSDLDNLIRDNTYAGHLENLGKLYQKWNIPKISSDSGELSERRDWRDLRLFSEFLDNLRSTAGEFGDGRINFMEFSAFLSSATAGLRVPSVRDDTAVQIAGIQGLQNTKYRFVFLAGLIGGKIPEIPPLLPYLNEKEDQAVWPGKKREKIRWERFYFISALISAKERLYLSCHDMEAGKPCIPSQFFQAAADAYSPDTWGEKEPFDSYRYSLKQLGRFLAGQGGVPDTIPENADVVSVLNHINIENYYRRGLYDTAYDGNLSGEQVISKVLEERFSEDYPYSPTSLEVYSDCPFRFYLKHVLGLTSPPEVDFTLSSSDRGSLIHESLSSFYSGWMQSHRNAPGEPDREEALNFVISIAEKMIESYGKSGPAWDSMANEILGKTGYGKGILEKFIEEEIILSKTEFVPHLFEEGFGFEGLLSSLSKEPVSLSTSDGRSIKIRGFVDRVDATSDGRFAVIDYKTGNYPKLADIKSGKALQLPLYQKAVEKISGMRGVGGFYYKLSGREVVRRAEIYDAGEDELFSVFGKSRIKDGEFTEIIDSSVDYACNYADSIRRGIFTPADDAGGCSDYCDFKSVCRFSEFRLLEQNEENTECDE
ncbi:hypothetical protein F1737_00470 [Methanoplanus sp. FWC-SCC4]|uniref:PD-(D/E)XK endonuclease-like domain-containing protein n=1 Tax=Methanochimaera problematica TaxID=2609417 RepID=A0AA97FBP4_9EURY|nr:PD-(D/E)XK nuclease family protein [Methanoplanus sp. FWC-SCC4]WOF15259.1 hypothetical protein F1737_00470 [Methanoplanus sp. FWC-SCC4]